MGRNGGWSLEGRALAVAAAASLAGALVAVAVAGLVDVGWLAVVLGAGGGLVVAVTAARRVFAPLRRALRALEDGVDGFRAGDFSLRLAVLRDDEVARLTRIYNEIGETMARQRRELRQRELLLASVIEATPTAVLLVNPIGRLLVANGAARRLLADGRPLEGRQLEEVLGGCPVPLREALLVSGAGDGLVSLVAGGVEEVLQVSRHQYQLNTRRHTLLLVRRLTPELRRREVAAWRQVLRVVGHEINNALAPIRSLIASGRRVLERGDPAGRLPEILDTIDGSAERLHRFVEGYRRVARLPTPRLEEVEVRPFLEDLRQLEAFEVIEGGGPERARFDPAQLQQVVLNLVRNAREAGSEEVQVVVRPGPGALLLEVRDRGPGMEPEAMAQALVPFWTTKPDGSGLGLALCREILEAHGGGLTLSLREGGGLVAACRLPQGEGGPPGTW